VGVAIKKIEGVKSVEVSLNQGLARVYMKSDNKVTLQQLRKAIETRGFTPKEAKVKVKGKVVESDGVHQLEVTGTRDKFKIKCAGKEDSHEISIQTGEPTLMEGLIPAQDKDKPSNTLEITC
jgi:copper chaperone CopZ